MELSTFSSDLKLADIKPEGLIGEYVSLVEKTLPALFSEANEAVCPACGHSEASAAFEKMGIKFNRCLHCFTLYTEKRPAQSQLDTFFQTGEARQFWQDKIWSSSNQARRSKMFEPLVEWVQTVLDSSGASSQSALVAEGFSVNASFAQAWGATKNFLVHAPTFSGAEQILEKYTKLGAQHAGSLDAVVLSDALDRAESPKQRLSWVRENLKPGGFCFVTGILSSGLDVLALGKRSEAILPPDRLNSFTFEGFSELVEQAGFEIVEFSTPGNLDLENVRKTLNAGELESEFFTYIFQLRKDPHLLDEFKSFLQTNRLSSSLRAVLRLK